MHKMATKVVILRAGSSFAAPLARLKNVTKAFFNGLLDPARFVTILAVLVIAERRSRVNSIRPVCRGPVPCLWPKS